MYMTEWSHVKESGFEEAELQMDNGETLLILRRWDVNTASDVGKIVNYACIRSGHSAEPLYTFPFGATRSEIVEKAKLCIGMPIVDFKLWMGINTQQICKMYPKKFRNEIKEFLND